MPATNGNGPLGTGRSVPTSPQSVLRTARKASSFVPSAGGQVRRSGGRRLPCPCGPGTVCERGMPLPQPTQRTVFCTKRPSTRTRAYPFCGLRCSTCLMRQCGGVLMRATGHADHRHTADLGDPRPDEPPCGQACDAPAATEHRRSPPATVPVRHAPHDPPPLPTRCAPEDAVPRPTAGVSHRQVVYCMLHVAGPLRNGTAHTSSRFLLLYLERRYVGRELPPMTTARGRGCGRSS
jgi:hypothetical protein